MTQSIAPYFLGVAGGTAGGKTTFARRIYELARPGEVAIVYMDSYYRRQDHIALEERQKVNYDHPQAFEFDLLLAHLQALQSGESVAMPQYDFACHTRSANSLDFKPAPIVIVEGILALHDPNIRSFYDRTIYVDAPDEIRLGRRIQRDVEERNRTRESVISQWNNTVQPMHYEFCLPTKVLATKVLSGLNNNDDFIQTLLEQIRPGSGQQ